MCGVMVGFTHMSNIVPILIVQKGYATIEKLNLEFQ
jgi:hypothetical protein